MKHIRRSAYEIILPLVGKDERKIEGKALLVNGLYGALDIVEEGTAEKLRQGRIEEIPLALRERLFSRGHITRKEPSGEFADVRLLSRIYKKIVAAADLGLVIMPTYDCNFRCPYCYESHRLARGQAWLQQKMSPEMMDAVFGAMEKMKAKGYQLKDCTLYGGEPLLEENRDTVEEILRRARGMDLTIDAITNGYDLDKYLELLQEYGVKQLQVTVDGAGEMNDRRRRHRDGLPTYGRIMENVKMALARGISISLRVNVNRENLGCLGELMEDLSARGLAETAEAQASGEGTFSYYFKAVSEGEDSPTYVTDREVFAALLEAGLTLEEAAEKESAYAGVASFLISAFAKTNFPVISPGLCGAEFGMLVIDPAGQVFSCWDQVGTEDEATGIVDRESKSLLYGLAKAQWRTRTVELMEPCKGCPYLFICKGGCASEAKRVHGSYFREHCGEVREICDYVASRAAGRRWEETGEEELSLSLLGPLSRLTEKEREVLMRTKSQREMLDILLAAGVKLN